MLLAQSNDQDSQRQSNNCEKQPLYVDQGLQLLHQEHHTNLNTGEEESVRMQIFIVINVIDETFIFILRHHTIKKTVKIQYFKPNIFIKVFRSEKSAACHACLSNHLLQNRS